MTTCSAAQKPPDAAPPVETGAARCDAEAHADPWIAAMRRGDFATAWAISDRILERRRGVPCFHRPRHEQYIWDGTSLAGKRVLVRCYHGLGDTIQFIRYLPMLQTVARDVVVWVQPELLGLMARARGVTRVEPLHDGTPGIEYDADVELMELPHVFRGTGDSLPAEVPYLDVAPGPRPIGSGVHVGIVWRSGGWDDRRSIPTSAPAPLASVAGVSLHPLQIGPALSEWPEAWGAPLETTDTLALARTMRALDLVLSVDSFPLHLAGALGVPVWALLRADPDWRWMLGRNDSPWYPTMRLWRQKRRVDWASLIESVAQALGARSAY